MLPFELLNTARKMELQAITQYMLHHYALDNMNLPKLAKTIKHIAIEEMKHAEMLAERVQDLMQEPIKTFDKEIVKGTTPTLIYSADYDLEQDTIVVYNELIVQLKELKDATSANLLEKILAQEEGHAQYFDDISVSIKSNQTFIPANMGVKYKQPDYVKFLANTDIKYKSVDIARDSERDSE